MFETTMTVLATIYEDPSREGEFKEPSLAERRRQQRLEQIKRARRHGKQLAIGIKWQQQRPTQHFAKARYYRNLDTIVEEPNDDGDDDDAAAKVVKRDWPKFQFFKNKTAYKYPSAILQKETGHGEKCAYCCGEFVHRYHYSKAPIYLINCGHIICGNCVSLNSRPITPNLSVLTRKKIAYVAGSSGMACPTCNVEFTWQEIHHFYL
jgi:hypothetical protein